MRVEVDTGGYISACSNMYDANHGVVDVVATLAGALSGGGGMSGNDTGGATFAAQYDGAAAGVLKSGCDLAEALGNVANLLNTSLVNHQGADHGALVYGPYLGSPPTGDTNPDHDARTVSAAPPPSALGGTGDEPSWWHWIASHVGGLLWPDADTGRLRSVGDAWKTASVDVAAYSYDVDGAKVDMEIQKSPEVPDAMAALSDLSTSITDLSTNFASMGQACHDYADAVDAHHKQVEDQLASFIKWTIVIEGAGAVVGFLTAGIAEVAAQAAEASEVANAATKVIVVLNDLIEFARLKVALFGEVLTSVGRIGPKLLKLRSARAVKAIEEAGEAVSKVDLDTLPEWTDGAPNIPRSGRGSDIYRGFTDEDRYGGLTRQEYYDKYWDPEKGEWKYPDHNGFDGPATPSGLHPNADGTGPILDRLGGNSGEFASPSGESYGSRALPSSSIGRDYHQYQVLKPLPDEVTGGKIAPAFAQAGGGTQYYFPKGIQWYIDHGYLKDLGAK